MANEFTLKLDGLDDVLRNLDKFEDIVKNEIKIELTTEAYNIQAEAVTKAPIDDGNLKNSIKAFEQQGDTAQIIAYVGAKYAPYQEFGTGDKVDIPTGQGLEGLAEYALQFKGAGKRKVNIRARQFFFPAVSHAVTRLIPRLQQIINTAGNKL